MRLRLRISPFGFEVVQKLSRDVFPPQLGKSLNRPKVFALAKFPSEVSELYHALRIDGEQRHDRQQQGARGAWAVGPLVS